MSDQIETYQGLRLQVESMRKLYESARDGMRQLGSELESTRIHIAELEAALADARERWIQEREAWIAQKAECVTLQEKLAEALEDSKRLEAVESGRLGIQYRDGVIRDEWKWSITYASTPIVSAATLRAAIDAARGKK